MHMHMTMLHAGRCLFSCNRVKPKNACLMLVVLEQRQKQLIREELQHVNQRRDVLREQQRNLREELRKNRMSRNVTIDNLDVEIRQLEFKLAHEPGTDPRKLETDIRDLNALRPKLRDLATVDQQFKDSEEQRRSISQRLSDCDAVLQDIKGKEEAERAVLDERNKDAEGNTVDIPTLNAEKQEVGMGVWGLPVLQPN